MIADHEIIIRLLIATVLGAFVGFERERRGQNAGLRTHMILSVRAALAMILSIDLAYPNNDPARLAAQVVSGLGFLGAGAILRFGTSIRGLTTAASLWTIAIVGLSVGAGLYLPASVAVIVVLVTLRWVNQLERRYVHGPVFLIVNVTAENRTDLSAEILNSIASPKVKINLISVRREGRQIAHYSFNIIVTDGEKMIDPLSKKIGGMRGVTSIEVSHDARQS